MFSLMKHLVLELSARGAVSVRIWQLADTINGFEKKLKYEILWKR